MPKLLRVQEKITSRVYALSDGETLTLHFKQLSFLDKTDLAAMVATQETIRPLFRVITGWENVTDHRDKKLPYSIEALDSLLTQYPDDAVKILEDVQAFSGMGDEETIDPNLPTPSNDS